MALLGAGVAAIWHDIAPEGEDDYHHWHCHEHVPERVSIPGFLRGRRYGSDDAAPRYFHFYETADVATLTSAAYLQRLNDPTPWTRKVLPSFRGTNRTLCRVVDSHGLGLGAAILTLRTALAPGRDGEFQQWLGRSLFPRLVRGPGIVGAHLLRGDESASRTETREKAMREGRDEVADWVVLVEAIRPKFLAALRDAALCDRELARRGAAPVRAGIYGLHFGLSAHECAKASA